MTLLNMSNIPEGMIPGLSDEELNWVTEQSADRLVKELDPNFIGALLEENMDDFDDRGILPSELEEEMKAFENENIPASTRESTKRYTEKFKTFLSENGLSDQIETMPVRFLSKYLQYYYYKLKKNDGGCFSPSTLKGIRAGIQRYLTSPEVNRRINIMKDKEFDRANGVLRSLVGKWLKSGNKGKQFSGIQPTDQSKIMNYFDRSTPVILQQEVWFLIVYHFGLRGRELLASFTKDMFQINSDSDGFKYIEIRCDLLSKNVKASLSQKEYENLRSARIYENREEPRKCVVKCFEMYLEKIPEGNSYLFPMPRKSFSNQEWYCDKKNVGKNGLSVMMKNISKDANLSYIYTNHCIRVTTISNLSRQGYSAEEISSVSGHKNASSVQRYVRKLHDCDKRKISEDLGGAFGSKVSILVDNRKLNFRSQEITCMTNISPQAPAVTVNFSGTFHDCVFNLTTKEDK